MFKRENWVKKQVLAGRTIKAMWSQTGSPTVVEAAVYAGWPIMLIDNEHGYTGLETTINLIRAVECAGGHVIVRVPWNDPVYLKRILDIGVQSLMIPMINNKDQAEAAVAACRYPPGGWRGYAAGVVRATGYGADQGYGKRASDELLIIGQIEHLEATANIDAIAAVDGMDMLFIGPNDLAGSIGKFEDLNDPAVVAAVEEAENKIRASGKMLGGFPLPGKTDEELEKKGYRFVARHCDIWLFRTAAAEAAKSL
ncbi:MAG: hypothetical protein LJE64_07905 [Desulfofustis sp.]|jgi:4-hydroxy-2-oxoheptanedioate aldolase|nr:hypothetical protein [Desulfofustis sp.]